MAIELLAALPAPDCWGQASGNKRAAAAAYSYGRTWQRHQQATVCDCKVAIGLRNCGRKLREYCCNKDVLGVAAPKKVETQKRPFSESEKGRFARLSCPTRARTWTFLNQNQACCQLHHRTISRERCAVRGCKGTKGIIRGKRKSKKNQSFFGYYPAAW